MKTAIVTVGPQGAGKSTYCEEAFRAHPDICFVSRDKLLIELFGTTWLDPYTGGHWYAAQVLWERVTEIFSRAADDFVLLLDSWNGSARERDGIFCYRYAVGDFQSGGFCFKLIVINEQ